MKCSILFVFLLFPYLSYSEGIMNTRILPFCNSTLTLYQLQNGTNDTCILDIKGIECSDTLWFQINRVNVGIDYERFLDFVRKEIKGYHNCRTDKRILERIKSNEMGNPLTLTDSGDVEIDKKERDAYERLIPLIALELSKGSCVVISEGAFLERVMACGMIYKLPDPPSARIKGTNFGFGFYTLKGKSILFRTIIHADSF